MAKKFIELIMNENKGSSGGDCTINIVDELPTVVEGVEGAYYGVKTFVDVLLVAEDGTKQLTNQMYKEQLGWNAYVEKTTYATFDEGEFDEFLYNMQDYNLALLYFTDIPDIYWYLNGAQSLSTMYAGMSFKGEITDTADATETGYYAYMPPITLYQYTNGEYKLWVQKGGLVYTSNGDGTCYVSKLEKYHDDEIVIPSISPSGDTVTKIGEEAFDSRLFTYIEIPDSITTIGDNAFSCCIALQEVVIPSGVTEIEHGAFFYCALLSDLRFKGTVEQWKAISKGTQWNDYVPATKVICTDGEVAL